MKTLSGKVVTTTPISLSKASKVLSNFVSADTGASQAVSAYLRRATAAFDELVQLHKDLNPSRKDEKCGKKRKMGEDEERDSGLKKKKKRRVQLEQ